jgi:FkbM family methyltransferase
MLNPKLPYRAAERRLREAGAQGTVVSVFQLAWAYPEKLLPYGFHDAPGAILAQAPRVLAAGEALDDDESVRQLAAHLRFRLSLDFQALPPPARHGYFPKGVLGELPDDLQFLDCGAYDGDTIRELLAERGERFARIVAVEPDPENYARLKAFVSGLPEQVRARVNIHRCAVGSHRGYAKFLATGDMSAAVAPEGGNLVRVVPLEDLTDPPAGPIYAKLDVEGAESGAVKGAGRLIREHRPRLAVSVYHRPDDLWEIPLRLRSLAPDHRLLIRTQGEDGSDVICYAVPRS